MDTIKESLTKSIHNLLRLKFYKQGQELIEAIESFDLKPILDSKPEDIVSIFEDDYLNMTSKGHNTKNVTVWLPLNDDGEPIFSIDSLKGAACFPWELDPVRKTWAGICNKKHIPIQLAQTYFYGVFQGKADLRALIGQAMRISLEHPLLGIRMTFPKLREYRFPISLDFEPEEDFQAEEYDFEIMEDDDFYDFCDYLHRIQLEGFLYVNSLKDKKYEIAVIGKNSNDSVLWKIILENLSDIDKTDSLVSGVIKIEKKSINVVFQIFESIPEEGIKPKNGIIFADFDSELEATLKKIKLEAKSVLFYKTSPELPVSCKWWDCLGEYWIENSSGGEFLKKFVEEFLL